jgi:hypothetical protein
MSYNGNGVFVINTAGQPVVTGTTISSTTFNNLTADLATGLTTALTKDGQSTPTANIGMGAFKITNLAAGTVASDAARLDQVQGGSATFITAAGTDTITGTTSPALTAYATGNQFSFVVANTNTGAVTINVDGLGAKAITRTGTTALVAGDMVAGQAVEIIYDGTRFQLVNGNSFTNLKVSGTLGVTGVATFTAQPIASSLTASLPIFTDGSKGLVSNAMTGTGNVVMSASPTFTGTVGAADLTTTGNTILGDATTDTLNVGNGGLVKDASGNVGIGTSSPSTYGKFAVVGASSGGQVVASIANTSGTANTQAVLSFDTTSNGFNVRDSQIRATNNGVNLTTLEFYTANSATPAERMRIDSSGNVGIGTASPVQKFVVSNGGAAGLEISPTAIASSPTLLSYNRSGASYTQLSYDALLHVWDTSGTEKMRLDSSGNLLVGTTSQFNFGKQCIAFNGTNDYGLSLKDTVNQPDSRFIGFINGSGTAIGGIDRVGSTNAVVYNTTSDQRLKSNIEDAEPVLEKLMDVKVRQYDWTEGNLHQDYGFIAQELEPVLSGVVTKGKTEDDVWQLDYSRLTPHLLKAIQEQQALITQLQADVATLKALSA